MKKILTLVLSLVCITAMLVGCGGKAPVEETEGNKNSVEDIEPNGESIETQNSSDITTDKEISEFDISKSSESTFILDDFAGVAMTLVSATDTELTVSIASDNENTCIYGEYYSIEYLKDGTWFTLPYVAEGNVGFNDIGYELTKGGSSEWSTNFEWLYGKLPVGQYRIVKDILDFRSTGDYDKYYLSTGFTIE